MLEMTDARNEYIAVLMGGDARRQEPLALLFEIWLPFSLSPSKSLRGTWFSAWHERACACVRVSGVREDKVRAHGVHITWNSGSLRCMRVVQHYGGHSVQKLIVL